MTNLIKSKQRNYEIREKISQYTQQCKNAFKNTQIYTLFRKILMIFSCKIYTSLEISFNKSYDAIH